MARDCDSGLASSLIYGSSRVVLPEGVDSSDNGPWDQSRVVTRRQPAMLRTTSHLTKRRRVNQKIQPDGYPFTQW
jgi:hypothetical protein